MCGIIGHIGPKDSVKVVMEGLGRLEYRGYDSAGISFVDEEDKLHCFKAAGKLENLIEVLGNDKYISQSTIGHTRWATHGEVNNINAHPHTGKNLAIVHNGIIENYRELKEDLIKTGYPFLSDTDSEIFLALILSQMENSSMDFKTAVGKAFGKIQGNSAFVVLDAQTKDIVAVTRGAPLVCGIGQTDSQVLVSSDPYALAGLAEKIYFPEDEVLCCLSGGNRNLLNFLELSGKPSRRYTSRRQEGTSNISEKGCYEHFMLKEIHEQAGLVRALGTYYFQGEGRNTIDSLAEISPSAVHIAACGSAHYAGHILACYLETLSRIPAKAELASEFRYRNPLLKKGELGIFISQSGETADTLAAQSFCSQSGLATLSLVNVKDSTLHRKCHYNLPIRAGREIGVASTKAFTQMALTGRLLSFALARETDSSHLIKKFHLLASRIDELLEKSSLIKEIAEGIENYKGYFYTGRGHYFPVALEGALKLKEIAYVHAEGYAAGELKHGPIALIDREMVNIAIVGPELYEKTLSNIQEIKARKGVIVAIGPAGDDRLTAISDFFIPLNFDGLEELSPLYVNVANQLLAYYSAKCKGTDIDKPRNLAKSVTVE